MSVNTYAPSQGWVGRGSVNSVSFAAGDQFGARVDSLGLVRIFKNGTQFGSVSAGSWPFIAAGGRLGLTLSEINGSVLDNFGGGTVVSVVNTPPAAQILAPLPNAFFYETQDIALSGTGADDQTAAGSLLYQWVVDLHHNTHVHPASFTFPGPTATLVGENHDDGTGVFFRIYLMVTDPGGLSDTTSVDIWPEADLEPLPITVIPDPAIEGQPVEYRFTLRNLGRMPAPISRWALLLGGVEIAARDTIVAGEDSVLISVGGTAPAAGSYTLRARADSLGTVFETNENNNAAVRALTVTAPPNTPPVAGIGLPANGSFYVAPDTVRLAAAASDGEQSAASLVHLWTVLLHRSTGDSLVAGFATDSADFVTDDFEDGNGVWYEVRLRVTDAGALVDSATVTIRPEQDLAPGPIATNAGHVAAGSPADAAFWLRNLGRLPARRTHWQLLLDGVVLSQDDTLIAALDSVRVQVALPPGLAAGPHALRAAADTLEQAIETDESNNASDLDFIVPIDATGVPSGPVRALALSAPRPNPTLGEVSLALDLPVGGEVAFTVLDLQGRVVMAQPAQHYPAGRWSLRWNGRLAEGGPAPPRLYLARVLAGGATQFRRIALVR